MNIKRILELLLTWLPLTVGIYALVAIIVGIRSALIVRKEAYSLMHKDFHDLKERVRNSLRDE